MFCPCPAGVPAHALTAAAAAAVAEPQAYTSQPARNMRGHLRKMQGTQEIVCFSYTFPQKPRNSMVFVRLGVPPGYPLGIQSLSKSYNRASKRCNLQRFEARGPKSAPGDSRHSPDTGRVRDDSERTKNRCFSMKIIRFSMKIWIFR